MKRDFTEGFDEIKKMTSVIRAVGSLNESINFEEAYGNEPMDSEYEMSPDDCADGSCNLNKAPMEDAKPEDQMMNTPEGEQAINQIREICLKGMMSLCKTPEDAKYQVLKKVFSMLDKAVSEKEENGEKQV